MSSRYDGYRETMLFTCGHTSDSKLKIGNDYLWGCGKCWCTEEVKQKPDVSHRTAKCLCGSIQSSFKLPMFDYRPKEEYDQYYCGCRGWD